MPKRYRAENYRPAPSWLSIWKAMYAALLPNAVSILLPIGFYQTFDIEMPTSDPARELHGEEKRAIEAIATALTVAAHCSHRTQPGVVRAWLDRIASMPELFRSKDLPPEVHWRIVSGYSRGGEAPGTHLQDLYGRRRVRFQAQARRPTAANIGMAARRAALEQQRGRGRPHNVANRMLAESLAQAFKTFGGRIVRRQTPIEVQGGGFLYVDSGPFYCFLANVIGPLRAHLRAHDLPDVTIETIERIASE